MIAFKDKHKAMFAIENAATMEAHSACLALTGQPLQSAVAQIVGQAVRAGMEEAFKQMYSEEDFERDLTLKP